ncbi:putative 4-hydroxy-4-methyl-2-oxoglutarate aldolase 3 [Tanacetum coccineum]
MSSFATAEVCDANASHLATGDLRALAPIFMIYGQCRAFSGPVVTLKVFEDNELVRDHLETKGEGRVLVIDGGGSMRCALVGGNIGQLAQNMGLWSMVVSVMLMRLTGVILGSERWLHILRNRIKEALVRRMFPFILEEL